ncbi:hypothetical protein SARC_10174 [Sphaeroforma arctica JP610]|uniref:Capsule synthesis protein CapA domain-containing protein n=1 Tax=Sphaeroforma arctica JP610 TaxID=667725 RepID=A0A0L0FMT4_9EUKA|nr:hypothetical protein SARC_10174 [Sphaeroforma arctica JP610]KNC77363.1 hypothetical protein SARC_10174 [Sphaeroforma arctica JP610]|eukprot:XP_014151265.1 hypothetical protein SARC_10174 [Sphaeroforma arctica JP610]
MRNGCGYDLSMGRVFKRRPLLFAVLILGCLYGGVTQQYVQTLHSQRRGSDGANSVVFNANDDNNIDVSNMDRRNEQSINSGGFGNGKLQKLNDLWTGSDGRSDADREENLSSNRHAGVRVVDNSYVNDNRIEYSFQGNKTDSDLTKETDAHSANIKNDNVSNDMTPTDKVRGAIGSEVSSEDVTKVVEPVENRAAAVKYHAVQGQGLERNKEATGVVQDVSVKHSSQIGVGSRLHSDTASNNVGEHNLEAASLDEISSKTAEDPLVKLRPNVETEINSYTLTFVGDIMLGDAGLRFAEKQYETAQALKTLGDKSENSKSIVSNKKNTIQKTNSDTDTNDPDSRGEGEEESEFVWDVDEPFSKVKRLLRQSDYVIGNLEAPITRRRKNYDSNHAWSYNMIPRTAMAIKRSGINAVGFANNHFLDRGPMGVFDTLTRLEDVGLPLFGLGRTLEDAAKPLLLTTTILRKNDDSMEGVVKDENETWKVAGRDLPSSLNHGDSQLIRSREKVRNDDTGIDKADAGKYGHRYENQDQESTHSHGNLTVGVVGFSDLFCCGKRAGNAEIGWGVLQPEPEDISIGIQQLVASGASLKVAYVHWGKNYKPITDYQRYQARLLVRAGFDLIVGSAGSHTAQGFEYVDGVPVVYSVGNYVFQTPGRFSVPAKGSEGVIPSPYAMVLHAHIDFRKQVFSGLRLDCIIIDNSVVEFIPRECLPSEAAEFFASLGSDVIYVAGAVSASVVFPALAG